jgi:hypothetical protein
MEGEKDGFKQILELLPEGWEAKAKELGAFERGRIIKNPEELLRLILLYVTEGKSMAGTSALLNLSGTVGMSKIAVFKRIQKSGAWLEWLCTHLYRKAGLLREKPSWLQKRNILLVDGSEDSRGGSEKLFFILHYCLDLFTLCPREFHITEETTGEKLSNFTTWGAADIVLGDRAYASLAGLSHLKSCEADYVLRLRGRAFNIYDEKGKKIDLLTQFSDLKAWEYGEITGYCSINGEKEAIRVCAVRKDAMKEWEGRIRLKRERSGVYLSDLRKAYNKYIIVITSLGEEVSTQQILDLYRTRWQIEIAFKRLKSLFRYNEMPARKGENIKTWFYGKLLLAALCETLVNTGRFSPSESGIDRNIFAVSCLS